MLSGDNGILQKATTAKQNSEKAQIEERINLAYHSALAGGQGTYTKESLEDELGKEFGASKINNETIDTSVEGKWTITIDGISLEVPAGTTNTASSDTIFDFGAVNESYKIQFGHIVTGYGIEGTWRLFYADNNNAYLIRDSIGNNALNSFSWFGTSTISTLGENLNKKYTLWELQTNGTDLNNNIKAVAALLDSTKWTDYVEEGVANWAIGAPTLEMFIESYNATHTIQLDSTVGENATGYNVKKQNGSSATGLGTSGIDNAIYCPASQFWWLASPSALGSDYVCAADSNYGNGGLTQSKYNNTGPLRPLVCVPISKLGNGLTITGNY